MGGMYYAAAVFFSRSLFTAVSDDRIGESVAPQAEPAPGGGAGRPTPAGRCDHGGMARLSDAFIDDRAPATKNRGVGWRTAERGGTQAVGATTWLTGAGGVGAAARCFHRRLFGPVGHCWGNQSASAAHPQGQGTHSALPVPPRIS